MPRSIWSGSISFGMVNIPVKLYTAVKDAGIHFHMLHSRDGARLHQKMVCPMEDAEVPPDEIEKGYEVGPDQYVVVHPDELEELAPEASRAIEISDFVDLSQIDPVYFQHPYYLLPEEGAAKAYGLLVRAMQESGKAGLGKFVMRGKEYLACLRVLEEVVCLETMRFSEEVVMPSRLEDRPEPIEVKKKELDTALQLIDALSVEFEPDSYHDEYRERVMELIESKAEGQEYVMPPAPEEPGKVVDLMSALQESLDKAKKRKKKSAG